MGGCVYKEKQGAIRAWQGASITAGNRNHLHACHVRQCVLRGPRGGEEVLAPQSERRGLRLLEGSLEGVVFELNFEERIRFFDRLWLGGWRTNDFAAAGNIMSKGMETGNCKTCPASTLVWLKRRSHELMQWDLDQNYGLRVDSGGLCTLSKECFWRPESFGEEKQWSMC